MTCMASSSAATAAPGVRGSPPSAATPAGNAPAPQPHLGPSPTYYIEGRRRLCQHTGRTQLQVGYVGEHTYPCRLGGDRRKKGPRIEKARLVGMILYPDQSKPQL